MIAKHDNFHYFIKGVFPRLKCATASTTARTTRLPTNLLSNAAAETSPARAPTCSARPPPSASSPTGCAMETTTVATIQMKKSSIVRLEHARQTLSGKSVLKPLIMTKDLVFNDNFQFCHFVTV